MIQALISHAVPCVHVLVLQHHLLSSLCLGTNHVFFFSASRTANNSPVTVTIDPGGDLYLIAGGELADVIITRFRVCSTTLARHSRVFKTMLFGNFAESKSKNKWGQDWEVALPEEKPEAMEVILTIAHAYFNKVPEIVTADYFCHILMVTNKYDLSPILKFSALSWFRHLGNLSSLIKTGEGASEFLYIALELGFEALYKWLIEKLAKITSIDSSGKLKIGRKDHVLLDLEYIPDCAQGKSFLSFYSGLHECY